MRDEARELLLVGRPLCDLCADLAAQLDALGRPYRLVDVDSASSLAARYGARIPVLLEGERELCAGPIATPLLEATLRRNGW